MITVNKRKNGMVFLMLLMMVSVARVDTLYAKAAPPVLASEAHISEVTLGHDKKISQPTEDFHPADTIFAAVEIAENAKTVKVKGRLHVVDIPGQKAGPIPGIETIVTISGEGTANFQFSKPTKGWPLGKYKFEALLINENGETIDTESHEFTVE